MVKVDVGDLRALTTAILFKFVKKYAKKAATAEEVEALAAAARLLFDMLKY